MCPALPAGIYGNLVPDSKDSIITLDIGQAASPVNLVVV